MYFDTLYYKMDGSEKHELLSILIKEINIYENKQPNGQWLKQIVFSLPIIGDEELYMSLDNGNPVETFVLLCRKAKQADRHIVVNYETQGRHMKKNK